MNDETECGDDRRLPARAQAIRTRLWGTGRAGLILILLGLALTALILWSMTGRDAGEAGQGAARPSLTVEFAKPEQGIWPEQISAQGLIAPWEEASIGTQIGSYQLIDIRANVGDQVRRGDVLARLNPALLKAEEAELLARHEQATANDRRAKGLQTVGGISDQEALQFATEARTATALLSAKRLELRYTAITAPDDGAITARTATLGAVVPAGQELFRMIRKNRLEWRGEVTATQLASVAIGQPIELDLPDGGVARALVRKTAPSLDPQSRLAIVYADITAGSRARAGMYVAGKVAIGTSPALVVPADCVILRDGRSYVVEITGTGQTSKVALRGVVTGRRNAGAIEIVRGIKGGERLVRRGAAFLNDGDVVRVASARKAGS